MRNKRIATAVATALIAVSMTACTPAPADAEREATIRVWNPQDQWRKTTSFYQDNVADFEKKYPNVTVEYVDIPYGQYEARYNAGFASGRDAPDIFMGQVSYYGGALGIAAEAPDDLQTLWDDKLTPVTSKNFQIDGAWHGYPVSTDLGMQLYYNQNQFVEVGLDPADPPQTFEELREYAQALAIRDGDKVTRNGMALRYSGNPTGIVDKALPYIHAFGGRLYAEDQSTAEGFLNSDETVAGIQYMQDLVEKDQVSSLELGVPDDTFAQGLSSMTFREGWYEGWLEQNAPQVNFAVVPYPDGEAGYPQVSLLFNWAWMVNDNSPNKDIAWDWMRTVSDPELDLELAQLEGYMPVWTENFSDPWVTERSDFNAVERQISEGAGPTYDAPYTNQIAVTIGAAIEAALQGADVRESLDGAVAEVDSLLERGER
ncbi:MULTISPECIES: ABC transporter substrate-binding protein [unclassified Cryobacterium]|uniref:ABC transporter substrate-binding protein n=1 Tax=unclassified Cryobacterium TaxID=2649013 RepID=UPI001068DC36|nr:MULTISPECIES: extracellular solute-binding protein [unclassified Cryobacterium]TFD09402.1 extracellular solute-binding protein [Cryobacterium sp. TMT1-66-1]TFD11873.1 extracellular solute-binding protein [Cryobacterium sp. TMT1-2-2]